MSNNTKSTATVAPPSRSKRLHGAFAGILAAAALAAGASPAQAALGIASFDGGVFDQNGDPYSQAGGHPFSASTTIDFTTPPDENPRRIVVDLPAGFVGNPQALPVRCTEAELAAAAPISGAPECPPASQIGRVDNTFTNGFQFTSVYAMETPDNRAAKFGFNATGLVPVHIFATVRRVGGEYRTRVVVPEVSEALNLVSTTLTFWGVPADPAHDPDRKGHGCGFFNNGPCSLTGVREVPFLTNPTSCTEPGVGVDTDLAVEGWLGGSDTASFESHDNASPPNPLGPTGCENVPFGPEISLQPTSTQADSPTGLEVELTMDQAGLLNPDGIAQAHLKRTEVLLPEGMAINPSAADGLGACSPQQIDLEGDDPPACSQSSKIGTVEIETPLLDEILEGSVYLAEQNDNPFGSDFAIYLVGEARDVVIKLPGEITPDPQTGQLRAVFDDNPQTPFSKLTVRFKGGDRASLVNPPTCGQKRVETTFTSWARPDEEVADADTFEITEGPNGKPCSQTLADRPFAPQLTAGVVNPVAGSSSPFVLRLTRQDGHQEILSLDTRTPEGLTAVLRGVEQCSDAAASAGACPDSSKVGRAIAGAGSGPSPFYVQGGEVFLAGPYKGAPLSLVIEVPAVAGPFDLGTVVVRAAVHVDPRTAKLSVISDPIPQILDGVPLRVKDIRVLIDRQGFIVSPTSCEEMAVGVTAHGSHGATAELTERFQVGDCASLGFSPKLRFRAKEGRRATRRNFHPTLEATVKYPPSQYDEGGSPQANIDRVAVTLPKGVFLDQDNLATICTRAQFAAEQCPEVTRVGSAEATTPLLDEPLSGPVYLIASDNKLPDIVADLNGIVDIDLYGRVDQSKRRIRNTFEVVPDAPVSSFRLTIDGGRNEGLLVNSRNTCRRPAYRRVNVRVFAHNGATAHQRTQVKAPCKSAKRKLRRKARQLRRKAHRLNRRGNAAQAKKVMRRARRVAKRAASTRR